MQTSNMRFIQLKHGEISEKRYSRFAGTNSLLKIPHTKQRSHEVNKGIVSTGTHYEQERFINTYSEYFEDYENKEKHIGILIPIVEILD